MADNLTVTVKLCKINDKKLLQLSQLLFRFPVVRFVDTRWRSLVVNTSVPNRLGWSKVEWLETSSESFLTTFND